MEVLKSNLAYHETNPTRVTLTLLANLRDFCSLSTIATCSSGPQLPRKYEINLIEILGRYSTTNVKL